MGLTGAHPGRGTVASLACRRPGNTPCRDRARRRRVLNYSGVKKAVAGAATMRRVVVLAEAAEDLEEARRFYDAR